MEESPQPDTGADARADKTFTFSSSSFLFFISSLFTGTGWKVSLPVTWEVSQTAGLGGIQLVSRSVGQSVKSASHSVRQLVSQTVGQVVGRSVSQLVGQSASQPVSQ